MQLGMIGLGRMGGNIVRRLMRNGHQCVVFDRSTDAVRPRQGRRDRQRRPRRLRRQAERAEGVGDVPAGEITDDTIVELSGLLRKGDILIDGGNSLLPGRYRAAPRCWRRRASTIVDVGTSGGVWGLERGYCMMIGGDQGGGRASRSDLQHPGAGPRRRSTRRRAASGRDPRAEHGYIHCGPAGAGHFVKMVHNGIEYGLMQAYAEGFDILKHQRSDEHPGRPPLQPQPRRYRRGLAARQRRRLLALGPDRHGAGRGRRRWRNSPVSLQDSGEGRWTIEAAIEEAVPADVLSAALYTRFRSRQDHTFAEKILSAMRKQFGGHARSRTETAEHCEERRHRLAGSCGRSALATRNRCGRVAEQAGSSAAHRRRPARW